MAQSRNEHRLINRRRDGVAPSGQKRGGNGPRVVAENKMDVDVGGVSQLLHQRGIAQREPTTMRRAHGLDGAHDEAGRANAMEIHIAGEVIASGPHGRKRRLQPHKYNITY